MVALVRRQSCQVPRLPHSTSHQYVCQLSRAVKNYTGLDVMPDSDRSLAMQDCVDVGTAGGYFPQKKRLKQTSLPYAILQKATLLQHRDRRDVDAFFRNLEVGKSLRAKPISAAISDVMHCVRSANEVVRQRRKAHTPSAWHRHPRHARKQSLRIRMSRAGEQVARHALFDNTAFLQHHHLLAKQGHESDIV